MNVLLINGSPHKNGCIWRALHEIEVTLKEEGIDSEILHIGNKDIRGCVACMSCRKTGKCVFDDAVNEAAAKFEAADGLVIGSPVYFASPNATAVAFMDRLFYSTPFSKAFKVGAAVASARRGGTTATFDALNKYFTISGMPVVSGQYWNAVHGYSAEDVEKDEEGLQQMRTLARNMAFLMKSIALGREQYGFPEREPFTRTNFIR
ncbi:MAG: flavodoxin family protein [Clostridia bacterium]|jgi:multimeric flavodoxin WrbA|nr:flavodoxin family protein [Clostridia bacterium]